MTIPERRFFRSWPAFVEAAQKPSRFTPSHARESGPHAKKFRGTPDFQSAIELATNGYTKGAKKAEALAEPMAVRLAREIQRTEIVFDVTGAQLDIARYLTNDPEHWMDWSYGEQLEEVEDDFDPGGVRLVRLVVNAGVAPDVSSQPIIARGAWIVALVKLLEHAGHRVEVVSVLATRTSDGLKLGTGPYNGLEVWTTVKEPGMPMDLGRIAFALAHPSMLRRLYFAAMESLDGPHAQRCEAGYGVPVEVDEAFIEESDIYIGKLVAAGVGAWTDTDRASAWVLRQLREQGVKLSRVAGAA